MKHELYELRQMQSLPLEAKINMTLTRIIDWREYWQSKGEDVYVSISGKDSTVLLHIARSFYPDIPAVFVDTGLEYPEVRKLALSHKNIIKLEPKKPFWKVVRDEGYPIIGKEASECICNTRKHLVGGGYDQHYRKLFGLGEYASKSTKDIRCLEKEGFP